MTFTIPGRLPGLNEVTNANRRNRFVGAKLKKDTEDYISLYIKSQCSLKFEVVSIQYDWYEKDKRRDIDNVSSAKKFINDAMVKCGVIPNDDQRHVKGFTDNFYVDKDNPRIEITIREVEK